MRINTNLTAMNTFTQYTNNNNKIAGAVGRLSSGYAINTAADNAAGLAISEKMRAQIRGLTKASANAQDAISLVQTAEGALGEATEILQRMRELAVQSSSDTNETIDRSALQDEFTQLQNELNDIAKNTSFNKKNLLDGSLATNTARLANVALAQSGLSVELGNAAAGTYAFSVSVQQESAAIEGKKSEFTAISTSDSFEITTSVTNDLGKSSLANGNYSIKAEYDVSNNQMVFTATSDKGQEFKATLSESELAASFGSGAAATLNFTNGSTAAFSFNVKANATYNTESASTMSTLASDLSDALQLSATGGVDAQAATYGVYANLTGAASIRLEAGMDSVTFSNGVKVNFDALTTSSLDTANNATLTGIAADGTDSGGVTYTNFKVADNSVVPNGTMAITSEAGKLTATITTAGGETVEFEAEIDTDAMQAEAGTTKTTTLTFKSDDGDIFTIDVNVVAVDADTASSITHASLVSTADGTIADSGHNFDTTFGTEASTFDVVNRAGAGLKFQVGANQGDTMTINIDKMDANFLGVASAGIGTQAQAESAIGSVDKAINQVSSQRAYLGAIQNRLEYKINNLETSTENLTSAESQIRDVDMAKEMTAFTNANILQQAATAMLAQANSLPQNVLSLIRG